MGTTGSSSVADSNNGIEYFSRAERDILEKLYQQLSLPSCPGETGVGRSIIATVGSCALEVASTQTLDGSTISNWSRSFDSPDDVEDLLSQLKLSTLHEEKKKSFTNCLSYLEKEVLPINFDINILCRSSSTGIFSSQDNFFHHVSGWLGRHGEEDKKISFIFELARIHHRMLSPTETSVATVDSDMVDCYALVDFLYRFAVAESILRRYSQSDSSAVSPLPPFRCLPRSHFLVKSISHVPSVVDGGSVSISVFRSWTKNHCPNILSSFYRFMNFVFFPPFHKEVVPYSLLHFDANIQESSFFSSSVSPTLYGLAACASSAPLFQGLHRLYNSSSDGLSWPKFEHSIVGYNGPTLFFIRAIRPASPIHNKTQEYTFGAYASSAWKKAKAPEFFGDDKCFLFQIEPSFKVIRAQQRKKDTNGTGTIQGGQVGSSSKFQYIFSSLGRSQAKVPCGIGFGGTLTQPRLFISDSLEYVNYYSFDTTFEIYELNPPLEGANKLEVDCVEIWGLGDDNSLRCLENHRDIRDSTLRKARQVDKAAFLGDLRSGLIESKMFDYAQQIRDRDGSCLLDCDS